MATYWENSCSFGLRCVSWYNYLIVNLVFSHLGFWSGNPFLNAPFPYRCLLVPHFSWLGPHLLVCCLAHRGSTGVFLLLRISVSYLAHRDLHRRTTYWICESSFLIHHGGFHDADVYNLEFTPSNGIFVVCH